MKWGFYFDQTTFMVLSLIQMAQSSLKRTFEQNMACVIVLIQVSIQQFIKKKLGDLVLLSSLSSCGLTLLTMAYKALMFIPASITLGNVEWKQQPLCCTNLD